MMTNDRAETIHGSGAADMGHINVRSAMTPLMLVIAAGLICLIGFLLSGWRNPNLAAKSEIFIPINCTRIPRKQIKESLAAMGCTVDHDQPKQIWAVRDGDGLISTWGERITVVLEEQGMRVQSKSRYPMQVLDFGTNARILKRFAEEWEKLRPNWSRDSVT